MNTVYLHGRLGKQFGESYELEIDDPAEAIRALSTQMPEFLDVIKEGEWKVKRADVELDESSLDLKLGSSDLHIIPATRGAGGDGAGKIIVGAIMVAAAFFTGGASIAAWGAMSAAAGAMGAGLIIAGASMMAAPTPETGDYEDKGKDEQSFLFDGPVNVNKQGIAVPLLYGEVFSGSATISAGIRTEDIPIAQDE